ncbi:hypothetical protein B0H17DRAFT_1028814 [Mycena rosella]|uniref:Uncharacterized protein n=1 Tax=Mycena rosella TaxID=1033263 RepID=A0AAD7H0X5_MYCRO|nr:hypothetical protein B0H17DRAFT_1028814 [Mycena rosella]
MPAGTSPCACLRAVAAGSASCTGPRPVVLPFCEYGSEFGRHSPGPSVDFRPEYTGSEVGCRRRRTAQRLLDGLLSKTTGAPPARSRD